MKRAVKYQMGDCLSIACNDGTYLAAFVSTILNSYYELTLVEYLDSAKPRLEDFIYGRFFGTRFGSWEEEISYGVDKALISCKTINGSTNVEKVGEIPLTGEIINAGYLYVKSIEDLQKYYLEELPVRIVKTENAENFPQLAFAGKHLIKVKHIIEKQP